MSRTKQLLWVRHHPFLLIVLFLICVDAVFLFVTTSSRDQKLRVAFLDVGQGDAVFIQAPNGNQLLYDAGPPSGKVLRSLSDVMPFYDRSLDITVLSHPDMDHIGGFIDIFSRFDISAVIESGARSDNGVYDAMKHIITDEHSAHFLARRGMAIDLGGGVVAEILYPDSDTAHMETNEASIVLRITYGDTAFLVSGDLPRIQEEHIVSLYGSDLHANVLKLGHHGSRTSTSPLFLTAVHPDVAVISAGLNNKYGHPHKETLEELEEFHIPELSTAREGSIVFESDGTQVTRK